MLKCFSLDEFLQLSFHCTFYRLYSCYHVLYIIANTVINMTTIIAFDIVLISFIIIWQLLYGYQGSSKTREVGFDIKGSSVVIIFFNAMITQQPFSHSQIWHRDKALIWEEVGTFCQGTWPKHKPGFQNSSGDLQIKCF